jgi:hypothetical protein
MATPDSKNLDPADPFPVDITTLRRRVLGVVSCERHVVAVTQIEDHLLAVRPIPYARLAD